MYCSSQVVYKSCVARYVSEFVVTEMNLLSLLANETATSIVYHRILSVAMIPQTTSFQNSASAVHKLYNTA